MGNKDIVSNKNSQGRGHTFERPNCTTCRKKHLSKCLAGTDVCFDCGSKNHKMKHFPNKNAKLKGFNQASLDPNVQKKNSPSRMGAKIENKSEFYRPGNP